MKIFAVGGAVRDKLLGLIPQDKDYVVVDSNETELKRLGYNKVGKSHDVYLHFETKDEYVLALNNSLLDELTRRDLTINSIAIDQESFEIIDPLGGVADIENKVLRHNPFFKDDPIRLLRLLRFKARLDGFKVAPETESMVSELLQSPNIFKNIPLERVENEILKGFSSRSFNHFIRELNSSPIIEIICGAKIFFRNIDFDSHLSVEEKLALTLSGNSQVTLERFFRVIGFSKIITSLTYNLTTLISLDLNKNIEALLKALEMLRWNESNRSFERYMICLDILGQKERSCLLAQGRNILKSLNLKQISNDIAEKNLPSRIREAKFQALTDLL